MAIRIEELRGRHFSGRIIWVDGDTIVDFKGSIVDSLSGNDVVEQERWVRADQSNTAGVKMVMKVTGIFSGRNSTGDGRYYGRIDQSGEIRATGFRGDTSIEIVSTLSVFP